MLYSPITIANYFLQKSFEEGIIVTPMKILKLVYIANGWFLGYQNEPLISEASQAWRYGPVINSVYNAFKGFGGSKIDKLCLSHEYLQRELNALNNDLYISSFLDSVWNVYKGYSAMQLSDLTHQPNTPWSKTYYSNGDKSIIPNDEIEQHYKLKISDAKSRA